jgi:predicted ferric reductase
MPSLINRRTAVAPDRAVVIAAGRQQARYRRRARAADLLVALCCISVSAAVALFLASGGIAQVTDPSSAVTAVGIVAGLVATDLLLLMMILAARIPLVDHVFGHDKALALHRSIGKPALYLLLAHAVLLTVGYGLGARTDPVRETISLLTSGRDMLLAYLALAVLVLVVVTSVAPVRRMLPYEGWHLLHLLSYVGVFVALPHELSQGQVLAGGTPERLYWLGLYVLAYGSLLVYRFAVPAARTLRSDIRVADVERVAADVVSIHMTGRRLDRLQVDGGQSAIWRFLTWRTWFTVHPVSFSAVPTPTDLRITVRALGAGTERLARLRPGTRVAFQGPYGLFTDRARTAPYLAIVTAGIGITPVRSLLEGSPLRPGEATVLLRASDDRQRYLWDEVIDLVRSGGGGTVYTMTGHRARGVATWMSASSLEAGITLQRAFPHLLESDLYVCGPPAWTDLVVRDARRSGVRKSRIHVERFEA